MWQLQRSHLSRLLPVMFECITSKTFVKTVQCRGFDFTSDLFNLPESASAGSFLPSQALVSISFSPQLCCSIRSQAQHTHLNHFNFPLTGPCWELRLKTTPPSPPSRYLRGEQGGMVVIPHIYVLSVYLEARRWLKWSLQSRQLQPGY